MTIAVSILAAALLILALVIGREGRLLRKSLSSVNDAIDQLRLTSRARINSVATNDNPKGEPRLIRGGRTAIGKRVVVGGSKESKQRKDLEQSLEG